MRFTKILSVILLLSFAAVSFASSDLPSASFEGQEKIGPQLRRVWATAMNDGDLFQEVKCVIKMGNAINKNKLQELKNAGLKVGAAFQTVITGKILIGDLPILVLVDGVKSVDIGVPVNLK